MGSSSVTSPSMGDNPSFDSLGGSLGASLHFIIPPPSMGQEAGGEQVERESERDGPLQDSQELQEPY